MKLEEPVYERHVLKAGRNIAGIWNAQYLGYEDIGDELKIYCKDRKEVFYTKIRKSEVMSWTI
jgi:hypothetical protein